MTEILSYSQVSDMPEVVARATQVLSQQKVAVFPTDSVYGIGCAATPHNPAYHKIFEIKNRPAQQVLPWLIADIEELSRFGTQLFDYTYALAEAFWPGALTLIVEAAPDIDPMYVGEDGTIALRLPDADIVRAIIRALGVPLATTSANLHGGHSPESFAALDKRIIEAADVVIDGGATDVGVESTIIVCTQKEPQVVRYGALSLQELKNSGAFH